MGLAVTNSFTRRKEPFEPLEPGRVSIYVCGPTVYDHPHIGHARAAVGFDVIRRTFVALGYDVTYVQNITDVDDKIIARSAEEKRSPWAVAEEYTRSYQDGMKALGVLPPDVVPRATGHIIEMLDLTGALIESGVAYPIGGDVYFSVDSFPGYGALSNRSLDEMRAGERVEPDPKKRRPLDFALWKGAKPGEPSWPSPWGPGRPGWHIECSAMSMKYLGETFDIHGGGQDLIFPHHENERAQSEAASGRRFARYWLHNGFVTIDSEKMSKSLKNFVTLSDVLDAYPAPAVRTLLVSAHYRSPIDFHAGALDEASATWRRLETFARNAAEVVAARGPNRATILEPVDAPADRHRLAFVAAMQDDFNTPAAIAALFELVSDANPLIEGAEGGDAEAASGLAACLSTFSSLSAVLGLDPIGQWPHAVAGEQVVAALIEAMLEMREKARADRDFATADLIRGRLIAAGIAVEDRTGGPRWRLAR